MNISQSQLMENAFVISIDEMRYTAFKKRFLDFGLDAIPRLVDGFKLNSAPNKPYKIPALNFPILGNSFTHASIVKWGKTFNRDFVCIFEDDAFPCLGIREKLEYYLSDIPETCGLLKLGNSVIWGVQSASETSDGKYIKGLQTWGCHAYIIFKQYYDEYFSLFEKDTLCDGSVFNSKPDFIYHTAENIFVQKYVPCKTENINKCTHKYDDIESFTAKTINLTEILENMKIQKAEAEKRRLAEAEKRHLAEIKTTELKKLKNGKSSTKKFKSKKMTEAKNFKKNIPALRKNLIFL